VLKARKGSPEKKSVSPRCTYLAAAYTFCLAELLIRFLGIEGGLQQLLSRSQRGLARIGHREICLWFIRICPASCPSTWYPYLHSTKIHRHPSPEVSPAGLVVNRIRGQLFCWNASGTLNKVNPARWVKSEMVAQGKARGPCTAKIRKTTRCLKKGRREEGASVIGRRCDSDSSEYLEEAASAASKPSSSPKTLVLQKTTPASHGGLHCISDKISRRDVSDFGVKRQTLCFSPQSVERLQVWDIENCVCALKSKNRFCGRVWPGVARHLISKGRLPWYHSN